jgi:hypothetical protein
MGLRNVPIAREKPTATRKAMSVRQGNPSKGGRERNMPREVDLDLKDWNPSFSLAVILTNDEGSKRFLNDFCPAFDRRSILPEPRSFDPNRYVDASKLFSKDK